MEREDVVLDAHDSPAIDYLTAHIWPNNWSWINEHDLAGTYDTGVAKVADYIDNHIRLAKRRNKPLVIEEFGYPRDGAKAYDPSVATHYRDRFYRQIYEAVEREAAVDGPLSGSNFWAGAGEAQAEHPDHRFRRGDLSYMGDPPQSRRGGTACSRVTNALRRSFYDHAETLLTLSD
jgi:mannan endo-1,4-beta-mannosidase